MIIDKLDLLCDAQALSATAISTNVIDLGAAGLALPDGEPLEVVLEVDVAADFTTGDETYNVSVDTSAVVGLTTPTQLCHRAILASALTAGSKHRFPLPDGAAMLRYLGINFTLAGTTPTVTVTAHVQPVSMGNDVPKHFPSGSVIA
jgi:hypothetical protein